jgi:predicted enzyme related to lactoylglutathione lyase
MKVTGIDAVYYTVSDVDAMTTFYTGIIGAEPQQKWPGRLAEWTFDDGNSFGLYGSESGVDPKGRNGSVMLAVPDVAAAVKAAMDNGVKFQVNGEITDTPFCHMAFGEDPEGNQFVYHYRKPQ